MEKQAWAIAGRRMVIGFSAALKIGSTGNPASLVPVSHLPPRRID